MKGVFIKDFLTLKRAGLTYLFCVLIFAAFGVFTENFSVSIAAGFFLGISENHGSQPAIADGQGFVPRLGGLVVPEKQRLLREGIQR